MELADHVAAVRAGAGDPWAMIGEFRRTPVLVPLTPGAPATAERTGNGDRAGVPAGNPMTATVRGVRWIYAFTDEHSLARFAAARGEPDGRGDATDEPWQFARVLGARLLDVTVPELMVPEGQRPPVSEERGPTVPEEHAGGPRALGASGPPQGASASTATTAPGPPAAHQHASAQGQLTLMRRIEAGEVVPVGVALDVADEDASMMFPPVHGIVPDAVAVDVGEAPSTGNSEKHARVPDFPTSAKTRLVGTTSSGGDARAPRPGHPNGYRETGRERSDGR